MSTQKSSVSLIRATSYEREALRESIETLLEPLGGITAFVKKAIAFYSNPIYSQVLVLLKNVPPVRKWFTQLPKW